MVLAFVITAAWDVLLRLFAEQKIKLFGIENISWVKALEKYFEEHTVLAAALIAGCLCGHSWNSSRRMPQ